MYCLFFFFFKQKTAYEMRISDWSSECALPIWPGPCTAWKGRGAGHSLIARQGGADGATHLPTGLFTDTQGRRNERAKTSRISRRQIGLHGNGIHARSKLSCIHGLHEHAGRLCLPTAHPPQGAFPTPLRPIHTLGRTNRKSALEG